MDQGAPAGFIGWMSALEGEGEAVVVGEAFDGPTLLVATKASCCHQPAFGEGVGCEFEKGVGTAAPDQSAAGAHDFLEGPDRPLDDAGSVDACLDEEPFSVGDGKDLEEVGSGETLGAWGILMQPGEAWGEAGMPGCGGMLRSGFVAGTRAGGIAVKHLGESPVIGIGREDYPMGVGGVFGDHIEEAGGSVAECFSGSVNMAPGGEVDHQFGIVGPGEGSVRGQLKGWVGSQASEDGGRIALASQWLSPVMSLTRFLPRRSQPWETVVGRLLNQFISTT